ncbi:hypothetical protein [Gorillibacterium sp. sgz5001074]|uniref:hypothetical protein n=1 Tax=Gorillibacterium sp. sgz5001074 TaxID=3446695 RepID=UPI003F664F17
MLSAGLIYAVFCCCCFYSWLKTNRQQAVIRFLWVLFMPVAGFIFLGISHFSKKDEAGTIEVPTMVDGVEWVQQSCIYRRIDLEKEMNIVPLEEVLLLNDKETKRRKLIDALKDEAIKDLQILELAVKNDDTETSHYAATAVLELKRKLQLAMQASSEAYGQGDKGLEVLSTYAHALKRYTESGFLDQRSLQKYRYLYSHLLERIISTYPDQHDFFVEKIQCEMELGEYDEARTLCKTFLQHHPNSEMPYILEMKIYYSVRNYPMLQETVARLKGAFHKLSPQALQSIRNWSKGEKAI